MAQPLEEPYNYLDTASGIHENGCESEIRKVVQKWSVGHTCSLLGAASRFRGSGRAKRA